MTCRHRAGDPDCSSTHGSRAWQEQQDAYARSSKASEPATPDSEKYEIVDVVQVGKHLVVKATYPNCRKCSYEGTKVMVYLDTSPLDAMKWRKIDPLFTDATKPRPKTEAPGPAARFPASAEGWQDAINYAESKA
jgi:hypothetical protein